MFLDNIIAPPQVILVTKRAHSFWPHIGYEKTIIHYSAQFDGMQKKLRLKPCMPSKDVINVTIRALCHNSGRTCRLAPLSDRIQDRNWPNPRLQQVPPESALGIAGPR